MDKIKNFKQDYLVGDHEDRLTAEEKIGWCYKIGHFTIDIKIKDDDLIKNMKDRKYLTVTIGDQIFIGECHLHHHRWEPYQIKGNLYDLSFPEMLTLQFHDEKSLTKNNNLDNGYLGIMKLCDSIGQQHHKKGLATTSSFDFVLQDIYEHQNKLTATVTLTYLVENEPIAKDRNVTPYFLKSMERATFLAKESISPAEEFSGKHSGIAGLHVILVPGLFTGAYPGYFDENQKALNLLKIHHSVAPIKSEEPLEVNSRVIRKYVTKIHNHNPGAKIVLVCHSKGGCDALEAIYSDEDRKLEKMIYGIVNMQCPIGGTPMVESMLSGGAVGGVAKGTGAILDKLFNTNMTNAVVDLGMENRYKYLKNIYKKGPVENFSIPDQTGVKFLSFCSYADFGEAHTFNDACGKASMGTTNKKIEEFGHRSDGLVCVQAGRIPGGDSIFVDNAFHTTPALHMKGNSYHSGHLTIALLDVLLQLYPLTYQDHNASSIGAGFGSNAGLYNHSVPGYLPAYQPSSGSPSENKSPKEKVSKLTDKMKSAFH